MFDRYIDELIKNLPKKKYKLDIVIEGGAFNGSYVLGILLFLKRMEKHKLLKVKRMSGCSVGGLLCFKYLTNGLSDSLREYKKLRESFYINQNFEVVKSSVNENIENLNSVKFKNIQKNKLFLTFHNINKQIIKKNYSNKEDLRISLLKTCHLPFLIDGNCYFKDKGSFFLDGLLPHIFINRSESLEDYILYISPNTVSRFKNMFITKNETSVYGRVSEGILDAYKFFFEGGGEMCSFVNQWSITNFISLRAKHLIMFLFLYITRLFSHFNTKIRPYLRNTELYSGAENIMFLCAQDFFLKCCF